MSKLKLLFFLFFYLQIFAQNATTVHKKVLPSTVTIETDNGSLGSGFFISTDIIVTNHHVVEGCQSAKYYLNGTNYAFQIEGFLAVDKKVDLVLLKVVSRNNIPIQFATENDIVGQSIFVIGSPKGLPGTISDGIISGYRNFEGVNLMQMTAPISSGSSGGPVLNVKGELIGISVSQLIEGQNLNFAIPKNYLIELIKNKKYYPESLENLEIKPKIGAEFAGGIVFYIDNTGKHGKVISKKDLLNNGKSYMDWQTAKFQCLNFNENGYQDWYLPSKSDLEYVLLNRNLISGFNVKVNKHAYWTNYDNGNKAWSFTFQQRGVHYLSPKSSGYSVRAIRNF